MRSGAADVVAVSNASSGPVLLLPALELQSKLSINDFDSLHPEGADVVIVPELASWESDCTPDTINWLQRQSRSGALVVSISEGIRCLAQSGLLEYRNAVGLAGALDDRRKRWPGTNWLTNRRYIQDGNTVSTAGVVAAVPMTMALVEAIVGRDKALALGEQIGVPDWSPAHDAGGFHVSVGYRFNILLGLLSRHESVVIAVTDGVDDLAL